MFFDDRLATVLRQPGASETGARTQFRQLLDILSNRKFKPVTPQDKSLVAAAWLRMDALAERIPANHRAAIIRERGWRLRSPELTMHLADCEPEVASAALNRADLSAQEWTELIPRLPVRARGFLRLRRDLPIDAEALLERLGVYDRGLPGPSREGLAGIPIEKPVDPLAGLKGDLGPTDDFGPEGQTLSESAVIAKPASEPSDADSEEVEALATVPNEREQSEISALVERIAQFRRDREAPGADGEIAPQLPLEDQGAVEPRRLAGFGFTAQPSGRIDWAEGEAAAMVIGTRLTSVIGSSGSADASAVERAFSRRQPILDLPYAFDGAEAIAGEWVLKAHPQFSETGHFTGYVGRFLRPPQIETDPSEAQLEADRIRQLLHELRTPVTAVQGYAEVIQQQLFGPAPHEYRALAASIAADAARILAGFEDLDRLARLETGDAEIAGGQSDFASIVANTIAQLQRVLEPRMAGFEFAPPREEAFEVALEQNDAEALAWRVLSTLAAGCGAGEVLACEIDLDNTNLVLTAELPTQLLGEDDLFAIDTRLAGSPVNTGLFGPGFALRLARAEAKAISGELKALGESLVLMLPLLTAEDALPSHADAGAASAGP